ncbi:MAG: hypothetical protein IKZ98_06855 [Clostridia bacterium]|nr:hypothetical protein [Clostridia bacterium]
MKAFAIFLIVLVLAAVIGVGWLYMNARMDIRFDSCIANDGYTQAEVFNNVVAKMKNDTFIGTRYTNDELGTADQYQFLTYTIHVNNHSFLKAEVIEIRITPMQGDVLQIGEETPHDLPSGSHADLSATILTDRNMHSVREATVTWYFWGLPFTEKLTLGK